ncbi:hypothetical protein [Listeria fleischmannii]|uniref:hypothetical protein n=1 Tax=Listeria fleischmannii TaxID=1069827 RepID=UPI0004B32310
MREQELLGKLTREQESLERLNQQLSVYDLETEESAEEKARLTAKKAELETKKMWRLKRKSLKWTLKLPI